MGHLVLAVLAALLLGACSDCDGDACGGVVPVGPDDESGVLQVTVAASGSDIDPDFAIEVPGLERQRWTGNETRELTVAPGLHWVRLVDLARNCVPRPSTSVAAEVTAGASTPVAFTITCAAPTRLRVTLSATGGDLPASVGVACDGERCDPGVLQPNASAMLPADAGPLTVRLLGVPRNCEAVGASEAATTLAAGATVDVAFTIACAPLGIVRITVRYTGPDVEWPFRAQDEGAPYYDWYYGTLYPQIALSQFVPVEYRVVGDYSLRLLALSNSPGCALDSPALVSGSVASGEVDDVEFVVRCS